MCNVITAVYPLITYKIMVIVMVKVDINMEQHIIVDFELRKIRILVMIPDIHLWSLRAKVLDISKRVVIIGKVISICTRHKTNSSSLPDKGQTFLADYLSAPLPRVTVYRLLTPSLVTEDVRRV